jgi:hypothetical protein
MMMTSSASPEAEGIYTRLSSERYVTRYVTVRQAVCVCVSSLGRGSK